MPTTTATQARILARLRRLCLSLPGTSEVASWGHPNFKVGGRTFAVYEVYKGRPAIAVKTEPGLQEMLIDDERIYRTPYVGHRGWVSIWIDRPVAWKSIRDLVMASYRSLAAKPSRNTARGQAGRGRSRKPSRSA